MPPSDAPTGQPRSPAEGPTPSSETAEFRLCRKEPAKQLLWGLGIIGLTLLWAWLSGEISGQVPFWLGVIAVVFYVISRIDETKAEEDRSVKVRISRDGIAIPEKFGGTIPWEAIENISSSTHKSTTTLGLVIARPEEHGLEPQSGWSKFWLGKGVQYDITPLEGEPDDVLGAIRWYAPDRLTGKL